MKKRILFVDDEPFVLQGLQRLLRPMREQWEMEFVESGALALERLRVHPCDVIVSDMMMPEMNGVQLLESVRAESPKTIRLVLSGHTEQVLALRSVGVAHQFLSKPCDVENLRSTITRVTGQSFAARSELLLNIVGRLERLPSLPATYLQLVKLLEAPASTIDEIGALMERDVALTAHLLKIVNSAFFGLAQRVNKVSEAVAYLGLDTLKALVLTAGLFEQWSIDASSGYNVVRASDHCQKVGAAARAIAQAEHAPRALADECFIAGLLHDVGKLILACNLPKQFAKVTEARQQGRPADENEIFGTTHAEIGSYLLGLWGLPQPIIETIRLHHTPGESTVREFTSLTAVHMADHLVPRSPGDRLSPADSFDHEYLTSLGLADRVPVWRATVEELFPLSTPTACYL